MNTDYAFVEVTPETRPCTHIVDFTRWKLAKIREEANERERKRVTPDDDPEAA